MRIDSDSSVKTWLTGQFSGSFKGDLKGNVDGTASYAIFAETASYVPYAISSSYAEEALTASYARTSSYAEEALTASYAISASHANLADSVEVSGAMAAIDAALEDPDYCSIFERLRSRGSLVTRNGVRVVSGSVEIDTGSIRIGRMLISYLDDEEALEFSLLSGSEILPPPDPPCPCPCPPCPPCPPPPKTDPSYSPSIDYARAGAYGNIVTV